MVRAGVERGVLSVARRRGAALALLVVTSCDPACFDVYVGEPDGTYPLPEPEPVAEPEPSGDGDADAGLEDAGDASVYRGDYVVAVEGLAALAAYSVVDGDLVLSGLAATAVTNASLGAVSGDVRVVDNAALTSVVFTGLVEIGGDLVVAGNPALLSLSLPALDHTGADVVLDGCPELSFVGLDALATLGGSLVARAGRSLRLDALFVVDGDLRVGGLALATPPGIVTLSLPALRLVGRDLEVAGLPSLSLVSAPLLESAGGAFTVRGNAVLATLDVAALRAVGLSFCVCDDPALPTCAAQAIADALVAAGYTGSVDVTGTDPTGICP